MPEGSLTGTQVATKNYLVFNEFETMNTQATRFGIPSTNLAWCENLQILRPNELATVPGPLAPAVNFPGKTIVKQWYGFFAGVDAIISFCSDGSLQAFWAPNNTQQLAAPATFTNPDVTIWTQTVVLVADPSAGYCAITIPAPGPTPVVLSRSGGLSPRIVVTNGGSGYSTPPAVSFTGGSGSGATAIATVVGGVVTGVNLTAAGTGYLATDVVTVNFGGPGTGAAATAKVWPQLQIFPITIAIFAARVWLGGGPVGSGGTLVWTGTGGYDDVAAANASGTTNITDADLVHNITALRSLNNFLWIFGDQSIKQIGSISISGATTVFSIVTLSSDIGTTFPQTICSYNRLVLFANNVGVWAVLGSSVQKISNEMDGIFSAIDFSVQLSAALGDIASQRVYMLLVRYIDPLQSRTRTLLLTFQNRIWYVTSQGDNLRAIVTAFVNSSAGSVETYGSSGTDISQLIQSPTTAVSIILRTAATHHGKPMMGKKALRAATMGNAGGNTGTMTVTIDTENGSDTEPYTVTPSGVLNAQWQRLKSNGTGVYLGMTLTGSFYGWRFNAGIIEYQDTTALASKVGA